MGQKNQNRQQGRSRPRRRINQLPQAVRDLGIASQKQLIFSILPYMQWTAASELYAKFLKIMPGVASSSVRNQIRVMIKQGLLEVTHGDIPDTSKRTGGTLKPHPYAYYRRVKKKWSSKATGAKARLEGNFGEKAAKTRARRAAAKPKPKKTTLLNLTIDDVYYIKNQHGIITQRALAQMFGIREATVKDIQLRNYIPAHLREPRAR